MKKIVVLVRDVNDPRGYTEQEIEATVKGPLAVHKLVVPYKTKIWVITHIASGRALTDTHTRADALELVDLLLDLAPWELDEAALEAALSKETRDRIAELCREYKKRWVEG